jgi:hypothetical protein
MLAESLYGQRSTFLDPIDSEFSVPFVACRVNQCSRWDPILAHLSCGPGSMHGGGSARVIFFDPDDHFVRAAKVKQDPFLSLVIRKL